MSSGEYHVDLHLVPPLSVVFSCFQFNWLPSFGDTWGHRFLSLSVVLQFEVVSWNPSTVARIFSFFGLLSQLDICFLASKCCRLFHSVSYCELSPFSFCYFRGALGRSRGRMCLTCHVKLEVPCDCSRHAVLVNLKDH